jgi:alpha-tubulin suppressor-like RCC1 family protein
VGPVVAPARHRAVAEESARDATLPSGAPGAATPGAVPNLTGVAQIAVSPASGHACAVKTDGSLWCWGANTFGQCGQPTATDPVPTPAQVTALGNDVAQVSVGAGNACAIKKSDGSVVCWGVDDVGQSGVDPNNVTTMCGPSPGLPCVLAPTSVSGLANVTTIAVGSDSACALSGGKVSCFGTNLTGSMLNAFEAPQSQPHYTPVALPAPLDANIAVLRAGVGVGQDWACAVTTGGDSYCWGSNAYGQIAQSPGAVNHVPDPANGVTIQSMAAIATSEGVTVPAFTDFAISATVCAIGKDVTLWCWGEDAAGQVTNVSGNGVTFTPTSSAERL